MLSMPCGNLNNHACGIVGAGLVFQLEGPSCMRLMFQRLYMDMQSQEEGSHACMQQ
jgi:hypothetical protein